MSSFIYGRQRLTPEEIARLRELERQRRALMRENRFLDMAEKALSDYLSYLKRNNAVEVALIARSEGEELSTLTREVTEALAALRALDRTSLTAMQEARPMLTALLDRVKKCHVVLSEERDRLRAILDAHIADGMGTPFVPQKEARKKKRREERKTLLAEIEVRLSALEALSHLPQSARKEIRAARATAQVLPSLADFIPVTLLPLEARCHEAARRESDRRLRYALTAERYQELCAAVGETPETLPDAASADALAVLTRRCDVLDARIARYEDVRAEYEMLCTQFSLPTESYPVSEEGIAAMEAVCDDLYARIEYYEQQEYMRRATEEVLSSFGYRFYGSTELRREDGRLTHMLFENADGSAVSMTASADGRISMSFGGLDDTERTPTEEERAEIHAHNVRFCAHRPALVRAFAEYGILLDEEGVFDPMAEEAAVFGRDEVDAKAPPARRARERADDESDRRVVAERKFLYEDLG